MTETDSIAELAQAARRPTAPITIGLPDGRTWLFSETGLVMNDITDPDREIEPPAHIRQTVALQTVDSLADYVIAFRTASTRLFADHRANRIVAVLDYHHGAATEAETPAADLLFHRATLDLPFSEEWKFWAAIDNKWFDQLTFARYLEENSADIEAPAGAELIDIIRDIHAVRAVNFKKAVRTATDNYSFEYSDETKATTKDGAVEIPNRFLLSIPVYFGGQTHQVFAFLRWKLAGTDLSLGINLHRAEHVRQAVFRELVDDIAARTDRPAVLGTL